MYLTDPVLPWSVTLTLTACLVLALLGSTIVQLRARRAAARAAASERLRLGASASDAGALARGQLATLTGTLGVGASRLRHPRDGAPTAIVELAASRTRFWYTPPPLDHRASAWAEGLSVRVGELDVPLAGPVELRAGSREWWPDRRFGRLGGRLLARLGEPPLVHGDWDWLEAERGVVRSVGAGEPVWVRGSVERQGDPELEASASYRHEPARLVLRPAPGAAAITVVTDLEPRTRVSLLGCLLTRAALVPALVAALLLGLATAHLARAQRECRATQCSSSGRCSLLVESDLDVKCVARHPFECEQSEECRQNGRCTLDQDQCWIGSREDCLRSAGCSGHGACSPLEGRCAAKDEQDCRHAAWCRGTDRCRAVRGLCESVFGQQADCDGGASCAVPDAARCHDMTHCELHGLCGYDPALDPRHCSATSHEACRSSRACRVNGLCAAERGRCVAAAKADCEASESCRDHGRCLLEEGRCVHPKHTDPCTRTTECAERGLCMPDGLHCIVDSDVDCRRSLGCTQSGLCQSYGGTCVAQRDADCQASDACRMQGRCQSDGESCTSLPVR